MQFDKLDDIHAAGFSGFESVADLRATALAGVPKEAGVYVVIRESKSPPRFLETSIAGWPKGRNPSVGVEKLRESWVPGTPVLYIGKAGGARFKSTLRTRLRAYLRHGAGRRAAHWGGRYIWQLAGSEQLLFAWKPTLPEEPREVERGLILEFEGGYGARPFGNRVR